MADESDVLIVGAGVAGALIAWRLARAGIRVTVVEAGPEVDRGAAVGRFKQAPIRVPEAPYRMRPYAEYPTTIDDTYIRQDGPEPFRSTYLRQVGGTTWHWLGTALRLLPHDLELRRRYGVGVDWPLNYADLAPWYDAAEAELGVAGHADPLGSPRQNPYPMPELPLTLGDRLMDEAAVPLGYRVRVSPQARNSQPFDDRPACCASASCIPICPVQAKYDATVHVRKAVAAGARILSNSVAVRIDVTGDGMVGGVAIRRPDRSETSLSARHIVIAAHAIEGPKLLLMSRDERYPNGVANSSGAVGRYLMDHPVQLTRALAPTPVWPRRGPQEVSAIHDMRDGDHRRQHGAFLMNVGNQGWEWAGPNLAGLARRYVEAGLSGTALLDAVRSHSSQEMTLVALTEQLPDPDNRVTPDFQRLDAIGVPKPRVFFRLDYYTIAALAAARRIHERLFRGLGATEIGHTPHAEGAGHIMGTTRMGADRKTSVANADGRSHDHPNLWFAGSSLFPTCGTANPTLTIAALALRTAEAIKVAAGR
ncbi:MAG: GMC family oxidoreductase [Xanthobacteraceae bacterium]